MTKTEQETWRWKNHTFKAMNTDVHTWLYTQTLSDEVLIEVERLFASFEKRLSRFDPASELSELNASECEVFKASLILIDAIEMALMAANATNGLYDLSILTNLEQAGYDRSFEQVQNAKPLTRLPERNNSRMSLPMQRTHTFRSICLNRQAREIYKPVGLRLDLGGMGKGWTVDRAADALQGLGPFLINAGGDIFAYHSPPGKKGWKIDLIHPCKPEQFIATLHLHHRALATSTIAKRRWQRNGCMMHHLIDPRTGQPAQTDALSVTVVADRTVVAEIYAKVALILGAEQGLPYLQELPGVEGLIYTDNAQILYTSGFDPLLEKVDPAGFLN